MYSLHLTIAAAEPDLPLLENALSKVILQIREGAQLHESREVRLLFEDNRSDGAIAPPAPPPTACAVSLRRRYPGLLGGTGRSHWKPLSSERSAATYG